MDNQLYAVFTVSGPVVARRIKWVVNYIPKSVRFIICSPTLKCFEGFNLPENGEYVDLNEIRDSWSKENEYFIEDIDEQVFIEKTRALFNAGSHDDKSKKFSHAIDRYMMPWLINRGITNFVLIDKDCIFDGIVYDVPFEERVKLLFDDFGDTEGFFGPLYSGYCLHDIADDFYETIIGPKLKEHFSIVPTQDEFNSISVNNHRFYDGYIRGFKFNSTEKLKLFYELWDYFFKKSVDTKQHRTFSFLSTCLSDEWIFTFLCIIFELNYSNISIKQQCFKGIIFSRHLYRPEDNYFLSKWQDYGFKLEDNYQNFITNQKECLMDFHEKFNGVPRNLYDELTKDTL